LVSEDGEPKRNLEVLQSWETLKVLLNDISGLSTAAALKSVNAMVESAQAHYEEINSNAPFMQFDSKSNSEHLDAMGEGIRAFARLAEIDFIEN